MPAASQSKKRTAAKKSARSGAASAKSKQTKKRTRRSPTRTARLSEDSRDRQEEETKPDAVRPEIVIRGAREHNLRDVDVTIPRGQLVVMTGVSGSGKSSLAFDTLYAEGQRRYVESLSSYARQFLGQLPKPDVTSITGLAPSIAIQQKTAGKNPRSTVGTITEIYDHFRILYARVGTGHCPDCGEVITSQAIDQIVDAVALSTGSHAILAPLVTEQKGEYNDLFNDLLKQGLTQARVDGQVLRLSDELKLERQTKHSIEAVVAECDPSTVTRTELTESVELALRLGKGSLVLARIDEDRANSPTSKRRRRSNVQAGDQLFSSQYSCSNCGRGFEPPSPQLFSFNSPVGHCRACQGLGKRQDMKRDLLVSSDRKSLRRGAVDPIGAFSKMSRWNKHIFEGACKAIDERCDLDEGTTASKPWAKIPDNARRMFLEGLGDKEILYEYRQYGRKHRHAGTWDGAIAFLLEDYHRTNNPLRRRQLEKYLDFIECTSCHGARLNAQARSVKLTSSSKRFAARIRSRKLSLQKSQYAKPRRDYTTLTMQELCALTIEEAAEFFDDLKLDETQAYIAEEVLKEIRARLRFLLNCGLNYLTLDRPAPTLSGGEAQRIRLAGQIGSGLVGVVYILDEPSIGLHPRDNDLLLDSLCELRDQGNSVVCIEHDEDTARLADMIVDFGPGPGVRGGEVVAIGSVDDVMKSKRSVTGAYLSGREKISLPDKRRKIDPNRTLIVHGARHNNLQDVTVDIPLGLFVCVTGVSGSGKSSLINDVLWPVLNVELNGGNGDPGEHDAIEGMEHLDKAIEIDQSPIGRTPRSNPATYIKLFDLIRDTFSKLPESRLRGYDAGRFSFNKAGGRCEACEGYGSNKLEMDFLADVWITCAVCDGKRFNRETLEVRFKGHNIADVLEMDVNEALEVFENIPKVQKLLVTLKSVGLDYLHLGQPSTTLSGGEAQRIKLSRHLGKRSTGKTLYILDEPTTGLHLDDVRRLIEVLQRLVDEGNSVLVIEHQLDVVKSADHVIDLGPDGGAGGGKVVFTGTPEKLRKRKTSETGRALDRFLETGLAGERAAERKRESSKSNGLASKSSPLATRHFQLNSAEAKELTIKGARQHNLQSVDLTLPRNRMSVFCGPSGSGKTSLAMDTLYAEGQRRYVESLSSYARQFLAQMPKPRFEAITGLSPAIAIEQKTAGNSPRSTVGTVTEIYDYLRVLYARIAQPFCPDCEVPVASQTIDEVVDRLLEEHAGQKAMLLAPVETSVGDDLDKLFERLKATGFARVRVDGETHRLTEPPDLDFRVRHDIQIVVDRVSFNAKTRGRLNDSLEQAFSSGNGDLLVAFPPDDKSIEEPDWPTRLFSLELSCSECGRGFERLTPHNFSFNSQLGWCPDCQGLGTELGTNLRVLIADPGLSLRGGAVAMWPDARENGLWAAMLDALGRALGIPLDTPWRDLTPVQQRVILYGHEKPIHVEPAGKPSDTDAVTAPFYFTYKGLLHAIDDACRSSYDYRRQFDELTGEVPCSSCGGSRLRDDAAAARLGWDPGIDEAASDGVRSRTVGQLMELPLDEALQYLRDIESHLDESRSRVAGELLVEAVSRLSFLVEVGLDYLTLGRPLPTLSGGEMQRIRLAGQVGRSLTGVLYVLDEPTIGLHPRDNDRLVKALHRLRDLSNTLLIVEHEPAILSAADHMVDFGPGAGRFGGTVTAEGELASIANSRTAQFLRDEEAIPIPSERRLPSVSEEDDVVGNSSVLVLRGASLNNLKSPTLSIPLRTLTGVSGVSGSGKSSLVEDTLSRALMKAFHRVGDNPGPFEELGIRLANADTEEPLEDPKSHFKKVITVDQDPIGATPASNPATYTGVFDVIRDLYANLPEAKVRGFKPGRFSFNRPGGRCEVCEGNGQRLIEMHFLPDVWVECEACGGKRYNAETLAVEYRGKTITDVLDMSIGQALDLFDTIPKIRGVLATLAAIGLDYLTLGQPAHTLSGGEAQRVKLAAELAKPNTGDTLYLLDEPTTGLHFDDIAKLLQVLQSLVEKGNTCVVIEHNLDVLKCCDWLIDVGPEAGRGGGLIVAEGTPEDLVVQAERYQSAIKSGDPLFDPALPNVPLRSYTGEALAETLESGPRQQIETFDADAARKKSADDVDIKDVGDTVDPPWKTDGRKWHLKQRLSHRGKLCTWDSAILAKVVDHLSNIKGLKKVNWNSASTVEIAGKKTKDGPPPSWFFHAHSQGEYCVRLIFRAPKRTITEADLKEAVPLKPLCELTDVNSFDDSQRTWLKNIRGPFQEITIKARTLDEIDTPTFWGLVDTLLNAYLDFVGSKSANEKDKAADFIKKVSKRKPR